MASIRYAPLRCTWTPDSIDGPDTEREDEAILDETEDPDMVSSGRMRRRRRGRNRGQLLDSEDWEVDGDTYPNETAAVAVAKKKKVSKKAVARAGKKKRTRR